MDDGKPDGQGVRDAATVLPVLTIILLIPPIILIFARPSTIAGLPLILVYVFGVWAASILAALWLSTRLPGDDAEQGLPQVPSESDPG